MNIECFTDNNECQLKTDNCDKATTTCTNTVGSFTCECKKGYSKESASKCTGQKWFHFINFIVNQRNYKLSYCQNSLKNMNIGCSLQLLWITLFPFVLVYSTFISKRNYLLISLVFVFRHQWMW